MVLVVKNLPANAGDVRDADLIPGSGWSHGEGHGSRILVWRIPWTKEPRHGGLTESDMTQGTWQHTKNRTIIPRSVMTLALKDLPRWEVQPLWKQSTPRLLALTGFWPHLGKGLWLLGAQWGRSWEHLRVSIRLNHREEAQHTKLGHRLMP